MGKIDRFWVLGLVLAMILVVVVARPALGQSLPLEELSRVVEILRLLRDRLATLPPVIAPQPVRQTIFERIIADRAAREALGPDEAEGSSSPPSPADYRPVIEGVSPSSGGVGTSVTLTGRNFAPRGNVVNTGFSSHSVDSPDGRTLTLIIPRPPSMPADWPGAVASYWSENYETRPYLPLGIYVSNPNGPSAEPARFNLTF